MSLQFNEIDALFRPFTDGSDLPHYRVMELPASGSARRYYRIIFKERVRFEFPVSSVLVCVSDNIEENDTFCRLTEYLLEKGIRVPSIYAYSRNKGIYLLQDLGDTDLLSYLKGNSLQDKKWDLIEEALKELVRFQRLPEQEWEKLVQFHPLDLSLIRYDCNYALENLIIPSGVSYESKGLSDEFSKLEERLLSFPQSLWGLMYRDFQSRNIMLAPKPYFIDYQSARRGPGIYDLVSFAWQAKAGFTTEERRLLISIYCNCIERYEEGSGNVIKREIGYWALFRIIQTLGAYGLRGLKEGKPHFIESIPQALNNMKLLMEESALKTEFEEIYRLAGRLAEWCDKKR